MSDYIVNIHAGMKEADEAFRQYKQKVENVTLIKHRETVLTYRELAHTIASMNDAGIFSFRIRKMTDEEKSTMKVKYPSMVYFSVEYDATDEQDDAWDLLGDNPQRLNRF